MDNRNFGDLALQTMDDIFAAHFMPPDSWERWRVVIKVLFGVELTDQSEIDLFKSATGRTRQFAGALGEAWLLCGRRSGKSRILSLVAVLLACFRDYTPYLAAGERATVAVLASDRDQAQVIFGYCRALIVTTPMLAALVERETADELQLTNRVTIGIYTSSYRSIRGRTLAAALADECAFWRSDDSRNPAEAVIRALRPSLATIPGAPLLLASSVYSKSGAVYGSYVRHWGKDASRTMCWKSDTVTMNPSFRTQIIEEAYASDAADAASEYGSNFRSDVSAFLSDDDIDAGIMRDRRSLPMSMDYTYFAFVDISGGRNDAAAICVAHQEPQGKIVVDRIDAVQAPFNPEQAIERFSIIMSAYSLNRVTGDNYSAEFVVAAFAKHGMGYQPSEFSKSEIYGEVLPLFTAQLVELPDVPLLENQLRQLERRPRAGGRDAIDHPRGGHDDLANAAAGALWLASRQSTQTREDASSVTHALRDHDPWAEPVAVRPAPRHLPSGFGGYAAEPDYGHAMTNHDPLNT
jgi:hypothetical protein